MTNKTRRKLLLALAALPAAGAATLAQAEPRPFDAKAFAAAQAAGKPILVDIYATW
jgi:hypothetical protein